ncbi:hypothetical protein IU453_26910 [Nocardia cyriacigeorgica]|uniref:hypothetical protein n=1 Tax=Nocardia cyriacigeorgica TaxID=135487 RepID=UPI001893094F|nr:hypothetical protein [Nocardia cyriacigeorgica]MBF6320386.1 hypothetical protein [Nocardia cyriacigeorgica]MBF6534128.1 hypothetical protein [Nocardia cyriacigeorgica]
MVNTPTRVQAHLLRAIQNISCDNHTRLEAARLDGHTTPPPAAAEHVAIGERSREEIERTALAVGVPKAWIDYVQASGDRGAAWDPGTVMLAPNTIERSTLISALARDVRSLQDMAAVAAAYTQTVDVDTDRNARHRRIMGMTWQRLGAIGHALALSEDERHQVWQRGPRHWATEAAAEAAELTGAQLRARFDHTSGADFTAVAMPTIVLQAAGVTADDIGAQMPVTPDQMVELAAAALDQQTSAEPALVTDPTRATQPGHTITATLVAAGLTGDPPKPVPEPEYLPEPTNTAGDCGIDPAP